MGLRYDWRCGGSLLVHGTLSDAWWVASATARHSAPLVAHDPATGVALFERPPPPAARYTPLARRPAYAQDVTRWGRVVTRVRLRPPPVSAGPDQRAWHFLRGGRQRKYIPVPNCFDPRWHLCVT